MELTKDSKFLEDYVIHQELPTVDFMKISFVAIPQEDFSKLFRKFLFNDKEKRCMILKTMREKYGEKVGDGFILRILRILDCF